MMVYHTGNIAQLIDVRLNECFGQRLPRRLNDADVHLVVYVVVIERFNQWLRKGAIAHFPYLIHCQWHGALLIEIANA